MNWELEEKRIELSFWVIRKLVRGIFDRASSKFYLTYPEPRYDDVYFEGIKWLDKL